MIRAAKSEDAEALADLILTSAPDPLAAIFDITPELSALNFLSTSLAQGEGQYGYLNHWVIELHEKVVGCVCAWHHNLAQSFHQSTLQVLTQFYGLEHSLAVMTSSLTMLDCVPKPAPHEWCIGHLSVVSDYKRKGIGQSLLALMQQLAIEAGKSHLSLDVESNNHAALAFYKKQGFAIVNESGVTERMANLGIGEHLHLTKNIVA